jgi:hypothetical protein
VRKTETIMTFASKTFAALLMTASIPLFAGGVAAAPLSQSMALSNADVSNVEQVQWRRGWRRGGWVGPAIGFGAGVAVGSALASPYYYGEPYAAYGYAPGYSAYGYAPGVVVAPRFGWGRGWCDGDESYNSANAHCRTFPRAEDRIRW